MTMTTVLLDSKTAPCTFEALDRIFKNSMDWMLADASLVSSAPDGSIGLIASFSEGRTAIVLETLADLFDKGLRRFVLFAPEFGAHPGDHPVRLLARPLWGAFPPLQREAFEAAVTVCAQAARGKVTDALNRAKQPTADWATLRLRRTLEARRLYKLLRPSSHGATADISNQFLAPARLLLLDDPKVRPTDHSQGIWKEFEGIVAKASEASFGAMGQELASAAGPVRRWLQGAPECSEVQIRRLMDLLTECRVAAGEHTETEPEAAKPPKSIPPLLLPDAQFKVLVVDDHAEAWRPVFGKLQQILLDQKGWPITFEFSLDGDKVCTGTGETAPIHFSYYDLVFLDVFLGMHDGKPIDGRTILKERIRPDLAHLPVFLWTTSRDDEITTAASLANGVLLKKSITWEALTSAISPWLSISWAKRAISLPNPFFNHVISDPEYRRAALGFTDWCLKEIDGFHALDSSYFRYFTDHGGRHIIKTLEILEQLLRPFLEDTAVLPAAPAAREFELLGLYLAALSHELGMFPMKDGKRLEDFPAQSTDFLDGVRKLHAVRGMTLLQDAERRYWSDNEGKEVSSFLHQWKHPMHAQVYLRDLVALVVGYHSRCLRSLDEGFLKWDAEDRFDGLMAPTGTLGKSDEQFRRTLESLSDTFSDPSLRERLRRYCALMRFADGIDIAASRNPALFLAHSERRTAANNLEYLKRQLCATLTIDCGDVTATFRAVALDDAAARRIIDSVEHFDLAKEYIVAAKAFVKSSYFERGLAEPWKVEFTDDIMRNKKRLDMSVKALQKPFDRWLGTVWDVVMRWPTAKRRFAEHLEELGILDRYGITQEGRRMIASVTALSVAGEVLDEYTAIIEGGLTDLRLGSFKWDEDPESAWRKAPPEPPEQVTILREGLKQYPAGQGG